MNARSIQRQYRVRLEHIGEYIASLIRKSLREQGHTLTGTLERSIRPKIVFSNQVWRVDIFGKSYLLPIDRGVNRRNIPFSPGSGKKRSKYIAGLLDYVKKRGLVPDPGQTQLGIAFAIARKQKETGLPTVNSRRFSKTRRRTGAIGEAVNPKKREIRTRISGATQEMIKDIIFNAVSAILRSNQFIVIN